MMYVIPYSAPGIKWGHLRIDAESSAEALDRAQEIHEAGRYPVTPQRRWSGPGTVWRPTPRLGHGYATVPAAHHKLAKCERSQIVYGEPLALVEAVAS